VVKSIFEFGEHATVAHPLDALALVPFGNVGPDEGKRDRVEVAVEHGIYVINKFARDGVLVGGETEIERGHDPLNGRPVQGGKPGADAQGTASKITTGARENRAAGVMLLRLVFKR
jgi:hypothetical protein